MFWFEVLATVCENSGRCWFSRPSELVSPRRVYQRLAQVLFLSEECSPLGEKELA